MFEHKQSSVLAVLVATAWLHIAAGAQLCGDCNQDSVPGTILDALVVGRIAASLNVPSAAQTCVCDVNADGSLSILDALTLAQRHIGLPVWLVCHIACNPVIVRSCRAVSQLGTTAQGPVGVNPAYTTANGGPGNPPLSGNISDTHPRFASYWDFDYIGINEGEFNLDTSLVEASGANRSNPVVLMSAGHDYRPVDGTLTQACNPADTFQVVLEALLDSGTATALFNLAPATTAYHGALILTQWQSSDPAGVSVSSDGVLTATGENRCATISYTVTSSNPTLVAVMSPSGALQGSFAACVDSGGIDTPSRQTWLPLGETDMVLPNLPSGPAVGGAGSSFGITSIINIEERRVAAVCYDFYFSSDIMRVDRALDSQGIGWSLRLGGPFNTRTSTPGLAHWYILDAFGEIAPVGVMDAGGINMISIGPGTGSCNLVKLAVADTMACEISGYEPCMPWSATPCGWGGLYNSISGTGTLLIP